MTALNPRFSRLYLVIWKAIKVVFAYAQSTMIDAVGRSLGIATSWTDDISSRRWLSDYKAEGVEEIRIALSVKNTVPNASAALIRRFSGLENLVQDDMRLCAGIWLFWIRLCHRGRVAYASRPDNLWRQNSSHSRTRPPGELEWQEGQRILAEASRLAGFDNVHKARALSAFKEKCDSWRAASSFGSPTVSTARELRSTPPHSMTSCSPTVTIVIPCYNLGAFVDEAVQSVLNQSRDDFEIIIIDDGSTDAATQHLFTSYVRPKTRIFRTENRGLANARNLGLREAQGRYVSCLDADDLLEPTFLERTVAVLEEERDLSFASCWLTAFGELSYLWNPTVVEVSGASRRGLGLLCRVDAEGGDSCGWAASIR